MALFLLIPLTGELVAEGGYCHFAGLKCWVQSSLVVFRGLCGVDGAVDDALAAFASLKVCAPLTGALLLGPCSSCLGGGGGGGGPGRPLIGGVLEVGIWFLSCCEAPKYSLPLVNLPFQWDGEKFVLIDSELWLRSGVAPPSGY